jgi:hypothetical protein
VICQFVVTIQGENKNSGKYSGTLKPRNYSISKSKVETMLNQHDFVFKVNIYYEFGPSKQPAKYSPFQCRKSSDLAFFE